MSPKLFTGLAAAAIVSLILGALVHASSDTWVSGAPTGAKLFPSLPRDAARIQTVAMKQGDKSLTLERKGEEWGLKDRGGYPVQADRVRALLIKLASAELVDRKTRNPERYGLLELEDITAKDAKSRLVSIADDKANPFAEILVGKRSAEQLGAGKGGTYVRRPGEKDTWLVSAEIDVNPMVNQWVDTTMFEAEIAKVARIRIDAPDQPQLGIDREAGKQANKDAYKLLGMPDGRKLKYDYAVEDIVNAFARVELEDVRKAGTATASPDAGTAVFESEHGLKITMKVRGKGDDRWAVVEATGDGEANEAASKINARVAGWEYKLPTWKLDQIFKKQADLYDAG